jgi:hypothetical protein
MDEPESESSKKTAPKVVPLEVVDEVPGTARQKGDSYPGSQREADSSGNARVRGQQSMRFVLTIVVASIADVLEAMFPPAWIPIDLATVAFFFLLWGFRWEVAAVLIPELIPGVNMFPSWILLALYLGNQNTREQSPPPG